VTSLQMPGIEPVAGRRIQSETADARGMHIVRLHQTLEDWRDIRRCAQEQAWAPLASAIISIEIDLLERKIAECGRNLF